MEGGSGFFHKSWFFLIQGIFSCQSIVAAKKWFHFSSYAMGNWFWVSSYPINNLTSEISYTFLLHQLKFRNF
jgi:hypothetical protein